MELWDWIDSVVEAGDSCTCTSSRDPVELVDEIEHEVMCATGCNLNGRQVKETA